MFWIWLGNKLLNLSLLCFNKSFINLKENDMHFTIKLLGIKVEVNKGFEKVADVKMDEFSIDHDMKEADYANYIGFVKDLVDIGVEQVLPIVKASVQADIKAREAETYKCNEDAKNLAADTLVKEAEAQKEQAKTRKICAEIKEIHIRTANAIKEAEERDNDL